MTLFTTEVRRLVHRRMLLWLVLVMLGLVVTIVVINAATSDTTSLDRDAAMRTTDLWLRDATARRLGVDARNRVATISVLSYLLIAVLGASAVGAEYRAGTVTTILTWEPRRVRLLAARLAAAAFVGMALYALVHVVFVGGWATGAAVNGVTAGANSSFWRELVAVLARGTLVAGAIAVISGAIATLGRNTAAALGIWFGYLVAVEAILAGQVKATTPWLLTVSTGALYGWQRVSINGHGVGPVGGTLHLALYLVVIGGVALAVFRRRDVA